MFCLFVYLFFFFCELAYRESIQTYFFPLLAYFLFDFQCGSEYPSRYVTEIGQNNDHHTVTKLKLKWKFVIKRVDTIGMITKLITSRALVLHQSPSPFATTKG